MRLKMFLVVTICLLALLGISLGSQDKEKDIKIMKVSDIKIGMKGYGKTVFEGSRIDKFEIEVLGIFKNAVGPKLDMILIRCKHHITDRSGIIAGMSGSPIYVVEDPVNEPEGKLIGALAYGWGGSEPIAGVTPIESMLADMNRPPEKESYVPPSPDDFCRPREVKQEEPEEPVAGQLRPLSTPLFISGMSPKRMKLLAKYLAPYNIMPIQSGGAGDDLKERVPRKLEPGSAIGVTVVRGDADWAGIGTVTYTQGDKFLAFGHPDERRGEMAIPATNAYIYGVFANTSDRSFKLGSAVETLGIMSQDQRSSISGVLGKKVGMVPVKIAVENLKTHNRHEFNYEIVKHRQVLPGVLPWLMMSATDVEPMPEAGTVEVITFLKLKGEPAVSFRRLVAGNAAGAGCGSVNNIFNPLYENPYHDLEVEQVSFEVKVLNENKEGYIKKVWINEEEIEPGETLPINIEFGRYLKPPVTRQMKITIPNDFPPQYIGISIMGGGSLTPELPPPTNVKEYIEYLRSFYNDDEIVAVVLVDGLDLRIKGQNLPKMPNSLLGPLINQMKEPIIASDNVFPRFGPSTSKPMQIARRTLKFIQPSEFLISGGGSVGVKVVRKKTRK